MSANEFRAPQEIIWTLYNANGRSVRGPLLQVRHLPGATYLGEWNRRPLQPAIAGQTARIALELGPKAIGCVSQRKRD